MVSSPSPDSTRIGRFNMTGLTALYHTSTFAAGFSNNERQAAARALLRHDAHIDGSHYQTRMLGGLHPSYISFNQSSNVNKAEEWSLTHSKLLDAATQDVFDALTMQDRLDGGISVLIRCAGSETPPNLSPKQAFAQEFAVPHLQRFATRCAIEKVKPSRHCEVPATHISATGPQHIPPPMVATGTRIQCSAQAPDTFSTNLQSPLHHSDSAAIRHDAALDRLKLGDENLLKLRMLVGTVCSSWWEAVFRSPKWDLTYEQASILSNALLMDLQHQSSVLTTILKILGILVFSLRNDVIFEPNRNVDGLKKYLLLPMVAQSFFTNKCSSNVRHIQPPACQRSNILLSKEARATLRLERRTKSLGFRDALDDTWKQLNDATKIIATSHHKSHGLLRSRRSKANLWNTFCWKKNQDKENDSHGKAVLQTLVCEHKPEYFTLSNEEQVELLTEFTAWKEMKKTGVRAITKLKINDITQTLKAVENELKSLHCHTGAESILYTTHGSTDVPLRGVTFATQGVDNFMDTVMGIDNQDLVSKMEGFAIQGMKGSVKNHQKRVSDKQECTGEPGAKMQWAHYFRNVVQQYQVVVEGWPDEIPFTNLSQVSSALPDLQMLCNRWDHGTTCWRSLSDEEFEKLHLEHEEKLESGAIIDRCCRTRSDKGMKHHSAATSATAHHRCKQYKSAETIGDSDGSDTEPAVRDTEPAICDTEPAVRDTEPAVHGDDFIIPFDCDAMLADLDRIFGPAPAMSLMLE
ncbi:uncharacterized protein EDB91DRAFT_1084453 [Suillus paluster]|uniref:uncharacterized protein n=1 Tax=Suillus paluster TaxID=48578 RepID=UPI001B8659A1|nr:uncharacterized protein EDB91DRAFT_1084453 [Suillus paluster]KAG1733399.1 hypothetical protein EDB91DRAFT_1084453 [Suillus paluster]